MTPKILSRLHKNAIVCPPALGGRHHGLRLPVPMMSVSRSSAPSVSSVSQKRVELSVRACSPTAATLDFPFAASFLDPQSLLRVF